ncbi:MAG: hypothetical protein AB7G76_13585 [Steroidobacteraceae bacterium]
MAIVSFSVPDEIKTPFAKAFAHRNKSAIIAGPMRDAVTEARRRERPLP